MNFLTEISRVKELMGVLNENSSDNRIIYYNKCEGGQGQIDPKSFIFNGKDEEGRDVIKFIKEPNPEYNNGDSKSMPTCLGEDRPFTERCFNIISDVATYEVDCETKKNLW
jgi:hypothetical protein